MQRQTCGGCGHGDLHPFLNLGESPIADAYTADPLEISKTYPLQLAVCVHCQLVQLLEVVDAQTLFGTGYSFYSSSSPPLSTYHQAYAEKVIHDNPHARGFVLEVGCNDGDMLRWFRESRLYTRVLGVDPAAGPVAKARARGVPVMHNEFTNGLAQLIRDEYGPADVVIANHVLAHVADVKDMLAGIATVLAPGGVAYIEVQYLQDLLVNNAFDMVYHEHRNFFTLTSLAYVVEHSGLIIVDAEITRRQQGSLRVKLVRDPVLYDTKDPSRTHAESARIRAILDSEWWLKAGTQAYDGLQGRVERIRQRLWDLLEDHSDGVIAGYGAPAKATTLLNFCKISNSVLDYVVDSTPAKQGRFIPGTGIPIVAPADWREAIPSPDVYLLLSWNYAQEIITANQRVGLQWILPLPAPMLL